MGAAALDPSSAAFSRPLRAVALSAAGGVAGRAALGTALVAAMGACLLAALTSAAAQSLPDPDYPDLRPELSEYRCQERGGQGRPEPSSEAERERFAMRAHYREYFPAFLARVGHEPAEVLIMPVDGVTLGQIADTWGAPRWDRFHEGVDIFAPRGTPVRAAAPGFVYRIDDLSLGGLSVTVFGDGGVRYFYTHFDSVPEELVEGQRVETGDLIGYVGNSGNAAGTPPHLHLGVYRGEDDDLCEWSAVNPLPLLRDRP